VDKLSNIDIAEIESLRDVAMATNFGTTLSANDMRLSYKGRIVFSQPLRLLVALSGFVVAAIGTAPWRATVRLGIDTLIANILVYFYFC